MPTRREVLASLTYACVLRGGNEALPEYLTGAKLYKDVQHYSDLGEHRTATAGDLKTATILSGSLPIPVMLLGKRAADRLKDGQPASILIEGRLDTAATAYEVVGHLDRGGPMLVVSTPASGWFHCAGNAARASRYGWPWQGGQARARM